MWPDPPFTAIGRTGPICCWPPSSRSPRFDCPLVALGCGGDHVLGEACGAAAPQTVDDYRRVVDEYAQRLVALGDSTLGGAMASIVAEASHDDAIADVLHRFGRARRVPLTDAARQVVTSLGVEPRVDPAEAIERFVAPFFYRHLVSGEAIDEELVSRQSEMLLTDLGLVESSA